MATYTKILLVQFLMVGLLISMVTSQNFHYSNGWQPGKRASVVPSSSQTCNFRPHIKALLLWIIEDEVKRIKSCGSSGFEDVMSLFQGKQNNIPLSPVLGSDAE